MFTADLVAIPDFAAGAMENWGLITYRMTALLYERGVSSTRNQQRVAIVVAHELAHQVDAMESSDMSKSLSSDVASLLSHTRFFVTKFTEFTHHIITCGHLY